MNIHYSPLDKTNTDTKHNNNKKIAENKQTEETPNEEISFFFITLTFEIIIDFR